MMSFGARCRVKQALNLKPEISQPKDLNSLWVNHTCPHTSCESDCRVKVLPVGIRVCLGLGFGLRV